MSQSICSVGGSELSSCCFHQSHPQASHGTSLRAKKHLEGCKCQSVFVLALWNKASHIPASAVTGRDGNTVLDTGVGALPGSLVWKWLSVAEWGVG